MSSERTSVLPHPANNQFIAVRAWLLKLCDNNQLAAMLISYFEYQNNIANVNNEDIIKHFQGKTLLGEIPDSMPHLWRRLGQENIREGIFSTASRSSILKQLAYLESKEIIIMRDFVNSNYQFDRRKSYLFRPWRVCELYREQTGNELACEISLYEKLNDPSFVDDQQVIDFMRTLPKDHALYEFIQCIDQKYTMHCIDLDAQCVNIDTQCLNLDTLYNRSKPIDLKDREEERNSLNIQSQKDNSTVSQSNEISSSSDSFLIKDQLTKSQHLQVLSMFDKSNIEMGDYQKDEWIVAIEAELLNAKSFKDCHQGFTHKLNVLLKMAKKEKHPPMQYLVEQEQIQVNQAETAKEKLLKAMKELLSKKNSVSKLLDSTAVNSTDKQLLKKQFEALESELNLYKQQFDNSYGKKNQHKLEKNELQVQYTPDAATR